MTLLTFTGYHGTSKANAENILNLNFIPSTNHDDWLGHGVYFFIDGISCPKENSKQWAINQAWDNQNKTKKYSIYSVLIAEITIESTKLLDLRTDQGLKALNIVRDKLLSRYDKYFNASKEDNDRILCNMAAKALKADALISNLYIKNNLQRKKNISSRLPNVSVLVVFNSADCIQNESIKEIVSGRT